MVWLVKNACGIVCLLLAWLLLAFAQFTILAIVLLPRPDNFEKYLHLTVFELLAFLTLVAHLKTILTDPGSVPQQTATPAYIRELQAIEPEAATRNLYKCTECCSVKPERAHHCSVCKRCIRKMDHHCPWVNNCIGERNQKYFVLFTLYVAIISIHALFLTVNHLLGCVEAEWNPSNSTCALMRDGRPAPGMLIMLVFLVFLSLLFSLFSLIMFYMQMRAIWTDFTGIEHLKKEQRERGSGCKNMRNVCGNNLLMWLSPFTRPPPLRGNEPLVGANMHSSSNQQQPV